MKKIFFAAMLIYSSFSGYAQSLIINHWHDPNTTIQNPGIHKIVVAALIYDQGVRREVEDYMITLYPGVATQSYLVMGGDSLVTNDNEQGQQLKTKALMVLSS